MADSSAVLASPRASASHHPSTWTFPPLPGGTLAAIEAALGKLLAAYPFCADDALVAEAYRKTIHTRGIDALAAGGGREVLEYLAHRLVEAEPHQAATRLRILDAAWLALPEWRS